ncbi:MAG: hypothetical protein U0O22_09075 [Acutalibacteraceae bacterium]
MELKILLPIIFAVIFIIIVLAVFIKIALLVKKYKYDSVEKLGNKLTPYLGVSFIVSILLTISIVLIIILR